MTKPTDIEQFIKDNYLKMSDAKMAIWCHVAPSTIFYYRYDKLGLTRPKNYWRSNADLTDEQRAYVDARLKLGNQQLAKRLGIPPYRIYVYRKSIGQATLRQRLNPAAA